MANEKPKEPEIDEAHFAQWIKWGFGELDYYLLKVARLDEYERLHPRNEEEK